ncbi:hypothetical protein [Novipirellula rosea]
MEGLTGWIIIGFVARCFFKAGSRTGSCKGYNVGRSRSHRNRR